MKWIKHLFKKNPNWVSLKLHPIKKKDRSQNQKYVIGDRGSLVLVRNGNKSTNYGSIDWVATESLIRDIMYDAESNSIDETHAMRNEEDLTRTMTRLTKMKRAGDELKDLDHALKDRRLPDIHFGKKSTSTISDAEDSKMKLFWLITRNRDMLESNGLSKSIVPVLNGTNKSHEIYPQGYVWLDATTVKILVSERGLELDIVGKKDKVLSAKPYQEVEDDDIEARHGVMTGLDEDQDQKHSIPENDAKRIIYGYYQKLLENGVVIAVRLQQVVKSRKGVKIHDSYYFANPKRDRVLNIRNKDHKDVSGKVLGDLMKVILWVDTFELLPDELTDMYRTEGGSRDKNTIENVKNIAGRHFQQRR
ncbi:hypothetical protein JG687_00017932 [Phytophthora cactorum]|uniref:Uncharacterized protein n=1 Tax=Phytophthora cactorum TaxID=29920 RepID=A0A8T1TLR4_9STRA|nr:hypothetical protein JG687_00017932 [Phytophthora cactorum]